MQEKERRVVPPEVLQGKINRRPERIRLFRQVPGLVFDLEAHRKRQRIRPVPPDAA